MAHQLRAPLYQRVFGALYQRIREGVYAPGQQLETEESLMAEFGVSKATVRQAVGELVARGLVVRQQGRGTYVSEKGAEEPEHRFSGSLTDLVLGTKHMTLRDLHVERDVTFPVQVRRALGMEGETGTVIRRRREMDGLVFAYTVQHLAPGIEALVTAEKLQEVGLLTLLHRNGMNLTGARQFIRAELADVDVASRLEVDLAAPVLFAERLLVSGQGPVEVVRGWYRGDLYRWTARFRFEWIDDRLEIHSDDDSEASR